MMLQCRTVQFMASPARMEGRNIAVFAASAQDQVFVRVLGDGEDGFDASALRTLPAINDATEWVFREWHGWFHDLGRTGDWGEVTQELDRINLRGLNFLAMPEQSFDIPAAQPDLAVDEVAELLIGKHRRSRPDTFEERIQALLAQSEIRYREDFIEDAQIEIETPSKELLTLNFPYLVNAATKTGIIVVKPNRDGRAPARPVSHAIYTFDKAVQVGLLQRAHCVSLVGPMRAGQTIVSDLARSSVLMDVFDPKVPSALLRLVNA
jgi:hypothetical protein